MNWILDCHVAFVKYAPDLALKNVFNFLFAMAKGLAHTGLPNILILGHDVATHDLVYTCVWPYS